MLSLFPELLFLAPFSAFIIRLALGGLMLYTAWHHVSRSDVYVRALAVVEAAVAVSLIVGSWVQGAALATAALIALWFFMPRLHRWPMSTLILALVMCLSLLVTGAGAFAFDLPL